MTEEESVASQTETPEPVIESVESTSTSEAYDSTFKEIESFMKQFKTAVVKLRTLKREIVSMEKALKKHEDRKARRKRATFDENGNKRKNGFSLENNLISDELADFIGHEHGNPISRSEVTRRLTAYVKKHDLQDPDDRRYVNLDTDAGKKLKDLLSEVVDKEGNPARLTIITINKFVNKHYVGKVIAPKESEASEEPTEETKKVIEETPKADSSEKLAAKKDPIKKKKKIIKKKAVAA